MNALLAARVVEREARVYSRLWRGSVFSSFVGPVLFLTAIGVGLGNLVDDGTGDLGAFTYLVFVTPGLLAASVMQSAAGESLWPVLAGTKWLRFFHGMVATPLRPGDVFVGSVAWIGVGAAIKAVVFLLVATALGGVISPWAVFAVPAAALTALAFAAPMTAYSATRENDATFSFIMRVGVVPLFLFSGTFFPVDQLPPALRSLVVLSPLWHGVELCRIATTGTGDLVDVVFHTAVLVALVVVGGLFGVRAFTEKLAQ
jgi:lipooligosaccharide transport system permease protein